MRQGLSAGVATWARFFSDGGRYSGPFCPQAEHNRATQINSKQGKGFMFKALHTSLLIIINRDSKRYAHDIDNFFLYDCNYP